MTDLEKENAELKKQIEELQAHVEQLANAAKKLCLSILHDGVGDSDLSEWNPSDATYSKFCDLEDVLAETPTQSLDRLKFEWQAEGALKFAGYAFSKYRCNFIGMAEGYADKLRKQNKELLGERDEAYRHLMGLINETNV